MQRPFRPKSPRGEPRDSHGQTLFMCKIKGFYCILVMHIVTFKIETPPPFSHSRGLVVNSLREGRERKLGVGSKQGTYSPRDSLGDQEISHREISHGHQEI